MCVCAFPCARFSSCCCTLLTCCVCFCVWACWACLRLCLRVLHVCLRVRVSMSMRLCVCETAAPTEAWRHCHAMYRWFPQGGLGPCAYPVNITNVKPSVSPDFQPNYSIVLRSKVYVSWLVRQGAESDGSLTGEYCCSGHLFGAGFLRFSSNNWSLRFHRLLLQMQIQHSDPCGVSLLLEVFRFVWVVLRCPSRHAGSKPAK